MATAPSFFTTPVQSAVAISTANTNRDGTGSLGTLATGDANGTIIEKITVKAIGNTTAGMIRIFKSLDGGVTKQLDHEIPVTAATPSGTVAAFEAEYLPTDDLLLPNANAILYVSTHNNEQFIVSAQGLKG